MANIATMIKAGDDLKSKTLPEINAFIASKKSDKVYKAHNPAVKWAYKLMNSTATGDKVPAAAAAETLTGEQLALQKALIPIYDRNAADTKAEEAKKASDRATLQPLLLAVLKADAKRTWTYAEIYLQLTQALGGKRMKDIGNGMRDRLKAIAQTVDMVFHEYQPLPLWSSAAGKKDKVAPGHVQGKMWQGKISKRGANKGKPVGSPVTLCDGEGVLPFYIMFPVEKGGESGKYMITSSANTQPHVMTFNQVSDMHNQWKPSELSPEQQAKKDLRAAAESVVKGTMSGTQASMIAKKIPDSKFLPMIEGRINDGISAANMKHVANLVLKFLEENGHIIVNEDGAAVINETTINAFIESYR
jgi:hypothetical protein